jgi:phage terminase large subunit
MEPTIEPSWKQHLAYEKLKDQVTEGIVFGGGAGGGKSWLGCEWILSNAISYPGTTYFIGRSELKQLRRSTIPTLYKVCNFHSIKKDKVFKYKTQEGCLDFFNGSRIDLIELKHYPSDPLYERFGSYEYTQGWIEEGGEIDEDAADMISSRTGRQFNDKYGLLGKTLVTCNPKKNWMYYKYYLPHKQGKLPPNKAFIKALVTDNTKGESGYAKKLEGFTGIKLQRLRYGVWEYDNDATALIDSEAIARIYRNGLPLVTEIKGILYVNGPTGDLVEYKPKKRITCDVARFGADSTVIGLWEGFHVKLWRYSGLSVPETAKKIRNLAAKHGIPMHRVLVDADGVGGGVVDILDCRQFVNASTPFPSPVNPAYDESTGDLLPENYRTLKAQCSYRTAEKINNGVITVELMNSPSGSTDEEQARLSEDLEQVKQKSVDQDGKLDVQPKKEIRKVIGRSTDYWDTIMMHEVFILDPEMTIWGF